MAHNGVLLATLRAELDSAALGRTSIEVAEAASRGAAEDLFWCFVEEIADRRDMFADETGEYQALLDEMAGAAMRVWKMRVALIVMEADEARVAAEAAEELARETLLTTTRSTIQEIAAREMFIVAVGPLLAAEALERAETHLEEAGIRAALIEARTTAARALSALAVGEAQGRATMLAQESAGRQALRRAETFDRLVAVSAMCAERSARARGFVCRRSCSEASGASRGGTVGRTRTILLQPRGDKVEACYGDA